jgi:hypothetical protein
MADIKAVEVRCGLGGTSLLAKAKVEDKKTNL